MICFAMAEEIAYMVFANATLRTHFANFRIAFLLVACYHEIAGNEEARG